MHELSIAQSLFDLVREEGQRHGLKAITRIKLQVGALSAVVPESLAFCFEILSRGTVLEGARLDIETVSVSARCTHCQQVFVVADKIFLCPHCQEPGVELVSGRELTLVSIEGETGENDDGSQSPCSA
jgi:hydrogenase nickel incorporation protein HypA/HybF